MAAKSENELTWKDLEIGCVITDAGNARCYQTGDWRSQRPTYDTAKCIKCGLCALNCPEPCIHETEEGFYQADLFYCKGCGTCARVCPKSVITMMQEEEK